VKPKILKPVVPNAGIASRYSKRLVALVREMTEAYAAWVPQHYRAHPPALAQDSSFSDFDAAMLAFGAQWIDKFETWAPIIAREYMLDMAKHADGAFRRALRASGWEIDFQVTPVMRDAFDAVLAENVALIKSIPVQFHGEVEKIISQAYIKAADVGQIARELKARFPIAESRADLIARDQVRKANAVVNRARALDLGITQAKWLHSHAGKVPRPDHVAAHGKIYDLEKGLLVSGEYIHPGELINCRCVSRVILPGLPVDASA